MGRRPSRVVTAALPGKQATDADDCGLQVSTFPGPPVWPVKTASINEQNAATMHWGRAANWRAPKPVVLQQLSSVLADQANPMFSVLLEALITHMSAQHGAQHAPHSPP